MNCMVHMFVFFVFSIHRSDLLLLNMVQGARSFLSFYFWQICSGNWGYVGMREKERKKERKTCDQRHYIHIYVYIMSLATRWMIALPTSHKIVSKRRIKGLEYWTRTSVIFIRVWTRRFLGRGLSVYNVFVAHSQFCGHFRLFSSILVLQ